MAVSCNPSDLIEGAKCYSTCLLNEELSAIELWLLTQIAGTTSDVQTLLNSSKCLENCVEHGNAEAVIVWLLTQIAVVSSDPNFLMSSARCVEACVIPEESKAIDVSLEVQISGGTSDLTTLLNNARCFRLCAADWRGTAIKIWLLAVRAGVSTDPATLIGSANCLLGCLNHDQLKLIETWLWCQVANLPVGPVIVTPDSFPDLRYWWRADDLAATVPDGTDIGGAGQTWIDRKSGNAAVQVSGTTKPTFRSTGPFLINGQPVAQFNSGPQDRLFLTTSITIGAGVDHTIIGILKITSNGPGDMTSRLFSTATGSQGHSGFVTDLVIDTYNGRFIDSVGTTNFPVWAGIKGDQPHLLGFRRIGAGLNNCTAFYNTMVQNATVNNAFAAFTIFGRQTGSLDTALAELLYYTRGLTDAEMASLFTQYFQPRYAL